MSHRMANSKRKTPRRHLIFYLRVFNADNNELIGYLGDLSTQGIMLVSEKAIPTDKVYTLKLHMYPESDKRHEQETLEFYARSIWCRNDVNPEFYDTGFELTTPDEGLIEQIQELIEDVGFSG